MAVNTTIASLSQTASANGPDGATDPPSALDDAIRYHGAFIAQLRDGAGYAAGAIPTALGYTPVQQGTGAGQVASLVKIGWSAGNVLRLTVDSTDFGANWPIGISGSAAALGGASRGDFVERSSANSFKLFWDGSRTNVVVDGGIQPVYTTWVNVTGRPTNVSSFNNDSGYAARGPGNTLDVGAPDGTGGLGYALPNPDHRLRYITVVTGGLGVIADGIGYTWPISTSDARLKQNVRPTVEDSLSKVRRMSFRAFEYNEVSPMFAGMSRKAGLVAQDLEQIDSAFITEGGDYKQLCTETLLTAALHAIQQLEARVRQLEGAQ